MNLYRSIRRETLNPGEFSCSMMHRILKKWNFTNNNEIINFSLIKISLYKRNRRRRRNIRRKYGQISDYTFLNYLLVFLEIVLRHLAINSEKEKNSFQKRGVTKLFKREKN